MGGLAPGLRISVLFWSSTASTIRMSVEAEGCAAPRSACNRPSKSFGRQVEQEFAAALPPPCEPHRKSRCRRHSLRAKARAREAPSAESADRSHRPRQASVWGLSIASSGCDHCSSPVRPRPMRMLQFAGNQLNIRKCSRKPCPYWSAEIGLHRGLDTLACKTTVSSNLALNKQLGRFARSCDAPFATNR